MNTYAHLCPRNGVRVYLSYFMDTIARITAAYSNKFCDVVKASNWTRDPLLDFRVLLFARLLSHLKQPFSRAGS